MSKSCPFCKKKIKDEDTCPYCHRVIVEKIEQISNKSKQYKSFHLYRGIPKSWLNKPFKLTKGWVIGGLILIAVLYFSSKPNNNLPITQEAKQETTPAKCTRTTPYPKLPEFERALSLINQRVSQYYTNPQDKGFGNCLNIQYSDLKRFGDNAEGIFVLDRSVSSPNNLMIYVDNSYRNNDDVLTAILLVHEITHVGQYYDYLVNDKSLKPCMEQEIEAFQTQFEFLKTLNEEERNSIFGRLNIWTMGSYIASDPNKQLTNPALINLSQMVAIFLNAAKYRCKMEPTCTLNLTAQGIRDMVEKSPEYKKQCNMN